MIESTKTKDDDDMKQQKENEEEEEEEEDDEDEIVDLKQEEDLDELINMQNVLGAPAAATTNTTENKLQVQIHKFTDRFKAFSNDLMRSIERAHDIADLHNSKFAHATVRLAAANTEEDDLDVETIATDQQQQEQAAKFIENKQELDELNNSVESIIGAADAVVTTNLDESTTPNLNYEKLITNKNNLKVLIDKSKTPSVSYLENLEQAVSATTALVASQQQMTKNYDESTQSSIYLSTSSISEPYSHLNQVDFRVKSSHLHNDKQLKRTDSFATIPDGIYISIWEVFIYLWGCIAFFIDIISDIILAIGYYNSNKKWLCALTLLFVIVPNVTLSLFSLSWYIDNYYTFKSFKKGKRVSAAGGDEGDIGNHHRSASQRYRSSNPLDDSYDINHHHHHHASKHHYKSTFNSITFWITTIIFLVLQLDLVYKYLQGFFYTLKGWIHKTFSKNDTWSKYYIEKQIKCDVDIGMLRLIDVFMDSGPQVLLQLYVITTQKLSFYDVASTGANGIDTLLAANAGGQEITLHVQTWSDILKQENRLVLKQVISISSSLFSMAYALAGYHRCLRNQQYLFCVNKSKRLIKPISWFSTIMQFLWYLFLISPRVLSMALFASTFRSWFFMIIFIHWLIMYFWILNLKTNYCITSSNVYNAREEIFEKFYNFVCSFIYIFVYFNLKSGKTRYRYLTYYIIFYLENILFSISYFCFSSEKNSFFKISMLCIILIGFWLAILFQVVYYLYFHPAQDISLCVRRKGKFHFIYVNSLRNKTKKKTTNGSVVRQQQQQQSKSTFDSLELVNRNRIIIEQQQQHPKIVVTETPIVATVVNSDGDDDVDKKEKFEYKLFHLNDVLTSDDDDDCRSEEEEEDEKELARSRSFKSIDASSLNLSIASNESSLYHSIGDKQHHRNHSSSSYGSCRTLKDEQSQLLQSPSSYSYNPLFLSYDLNSFVNNKELLVSSSTSTAETQSLKQHIDSLKTKETSL